MERPEHHYQLVLRHPLKFLLQILSGFRRNQGLLLSGAVAYYALLSIVPLITLILLVLSHVISEQLLLDTLRHYIELIVPSHAEAIIGQMALFLDQRGVISWILVGVLLFFSSMAFTVLENAISFIFYHRVEIHRRHFLVSAILPYIYILVLGTGFLMVSLISGALTTIETRDVVLFGYTWSLEGFSRIFLYLLGVVGQIPDSHLLLPGYAAGETLVSSCAGGRYYRRIALGADTAPAGCGISPHCHSSTLSTALSVRRSLFFSVSKRPV